MPSGPVTNFSTQGGARVCFRNGDRVTAVQRPAIRLQNELAVNTCHATPCHELHSMLLRLGFVLIHLHETTSADGVNCRLRAPGRLRWIKGQIFGGECEGDSARATFLRGSTDSRGGSRESGDGAGASSSLGHQACDLASSLPSI